MIHAHVDDAQLQNLIKRLQSAVRDLQPAMKSIGQSILQHVALGFRGQHNPWGQAWQPLARSTIKRRRKGKGSGGPQILRDTGRLQNSISAHTTPHSVTVGTNVLYAAVHQFGASINQAARIQTLYFKQKKNGQVGNRFVRKDKSNFAQEAVRRASVINIPARPFLPIVGNRVDLPDNWRDDIIRIIERRIQKTTQG